jgi:2-polyprenyl-6-methoxyphenol hydroxylase-like FAD-dependent oxidoreductase
MTTDSYHERVPVLIVGGGSVGLITSLLLARHGVRSLVAERHPGTSILPRAFGLNVRTMEIFRVLGLEEAIQAVEVDVRGLPLLLAMRTLNGPVLESVPFRNTGDPGDPAWPSPARTIFCAQDVLDPILVQALGRAGLAELRYGTEVSGFRPDPAGVIAELTDRRDGTCRVVKADYLIAADGANSSVREAIGIGMTGHDISTEISVLFEADLSRPLGAKRAILYRLHNQWLPHGGLFRNIDGRNRWTMFTRDTGHARPARIAEIIRGCAGDPDLQVGILASGAWRKAALLAERFRAGRVFLAGDAAHRLTPAGGLGLNTGIQGAHNLGWKLAAVLHGWAGPDLLDTYEAEWRPVARRSVELSYRIETTGHRAASKMLGQMLGAAYQEGAFVPDGTCAPDVADPVSDYIPTARPGHRAPHYPLSCDWCRRSTIDLFDRNFVVLSPSERWHDAARVTGAARGVPMSAYVIADPAWAARYGVGPEGAVLVRPDGYVAWRSAEVRDDMPGDLSWAMNTVLRRDRALARDHPSPDG